MHFTKEYLAYLGGFFDGEGSLLLRTDNRVNRNYYQYYQLQVGQTIEEPLLRYVNVFGGKVYKRKQLTMGGKVYYQYMVLKQDRVIDILYNLIPYLIVKEGKARVALEWFGLSAPEPCMENIDEVSNSILYAYCAGMFDAEGSITIRKREGNKFTPVVKVRQNEEYICLLFQWLFGGYIYKSKTSIGNDTYEWICGQSSGNVESFYECIKDQLLIKKKQLKLLVEMSKIKLNNNGKDLRVVDKKLLVEEILGMNK